MTDSGFRVQNIPQRLRDMNQWLCWKAQPDNGKVQKVPVHPETGFRVGTTDPTARTSFDVALESFQSQQEFAGIGFVFTDADSFAGIDLDRCLNPDGSFIWGEDIVRSFNSYTEVSPSGRGVKLFVRANKPSHASCQVDNASPHRDGKIEVYDRARFFTVTGRVLRQYSAEVESRQPQMTSLCEKFWPPRLVPPPRDRPNQTDDAIEKRALTYLDAMPPAISGSGGHSQTYAAATVLVHGFGLTPDAALAVARQPRS